jgi:hypothetical protein
MFCLVEELSCAALEDNNADSVDTDTGSASQ